MTNCARLATARIALLATAFGLGFAGIVPAYVLALRELFPAGEAGWRVPSMAFFGLLGMAAGAWMGGLLYDHFGSYAVAFEAGVVGNLLNLMVIGLLVMRQHGRLVFRVVVMP